MSDKKKTTEEEAVVKPLGRHMPGPGENEEPVTEPEAPATDPAKTDDVVKPTGRHMP
ncbi:hypothetical protein G5C51_31245 [Streptomyces sp. A7024]|uniref:Uncharacterized protein n=1 Tax=Streptomyces coryli TaxID=1128680 RepID=A0A6G4U8N2_9ACTN|nr:hypothetical protein [Streptomyces coryli]NGN68362.1 hypothetical protein [Streptomyces coryli]